MTTLTYQILGRHRLKAEAGLEMGCKVTCRYTVTIETKAAYIACPICYNWKYNGGLGDVSGGDLASLK